MQLGSVRLSSGSEGEGKRVENVLVEHDGSTHYRQVVVLGGPSTSAAGLDVVEITSTAPSSDVYALPVRLAANSTAYVAGAVAVSSGVILGPGSSANTLGNVTVSNALAFSSGSVAPTSQWTVTAALAAGSTASVAPTSQWDVRVVGAGSSGVAGTNLISTGVTGPAIDPRQVTIVAATSGAGLGTILSTGLGGDSIDPRARTWTLSTGETVVARDKYGTTGNRVLKTFYSTAFSPGTTIAMTTMHQVTDLSSGSSGSSFNVSTGMNFKITWLTAAVQGTTANSGWVDFAVRAVATTSGSTMTNVPVFGPLRINASVQGTTTVLRQGDQALALAGLDIVLPSGASFGGTAIASSSTVEASFAFGGYYFTP